MLIGRACSRKPRGICKERCWKAWRQEHCRGGSRIFRKGGDAAKNAQEVMSDRYRAKKVCGRQSEFPRQLQAICLHLLILKFTLRELGSHRRTKQRTNVTHFKINKLF